MESGVSLTLPLGALVLAAVFVLLRWLTPLGGKQSALMIALLAVIVYLPYALVRWPGADVFAIHLAVYGVVAYGLGIVGAQQDARAAAGAARGGWFHWAPAALIAFFLVIIAMDAVFVTVSMQGVPDRVRTGLLVDAGQRESVHTLFPGVVRDHYYQKEKAFNAYVQRMEAQRRRGWQVRKGWLTAAPAAGHREVFQVAVTDARGRPVSGAEVRGRFLRPSNSRLDRAFVMEEVEPGLYRAPLVLPEPGHWRLRLRIRRGEAVHEVRASTTLGRARAADRAAGRRQPG